MKKSDFLVRLNRLIKDVAPYTYPETKNDYVPNFTKPVKIQTSWIKNFKTFSNMIKRMKELDLNGLKWTYNNLDDEYSKEMMLKVLVYSLCDDVKIRFPLYYANEWAKLDELEQQMRLDDEEISLWNDFIKLKKYDISILDCNFKIWFSICGIFIDFINEQYRYKDIVKVEEGDFVIDGGACYGDTALYFAAKGAEKVFSFEFMDENVDIFNKNIDMNPQYKKNIELIKKPLSKSSDESLYATSNGPGTCVTSIKFDGATKFGTISIDDFVEQNNIEKIDFIKLDVEGSEEAVLQGAKKTIQKFKPKLAICVYHKKEDLWTLPQLIKEILSEYKLYFDHKTIHAQETLVYAKV